MHGKLIPDKMFGHEPLNPGAFLVSLHRSALTLTHVLCDYIDGFFRHHGVELDQLLVPQFLHDLGLLQEGLRRHGARLQSLYGDSCGTVPGS